MARFLPYVILLAEVLLFFRHVLFVGGYVIPWDLRYDHYPVAAFIAESFERGELPLWDPTTYCGRPLYANIQAQVFYPPTVATLLLSNAIGGMHLLYLLEWQLVLHVFLGGIFSYLLLRRLGASQPAALAGATIYQLGSFFASQAQHLGAINAGGWLPLTWLSIAHLRERITLRWTLLLAAAFAFVILAGLPSITAVVFVSCGLLALAFLAFRLTRWTLLAAVAAAAAGSLLLSALQLVPTIELTFHSVAQYRDAWLGSGGGLPLESFVSLVIPNYYGIFDLTRYSLPYDPTFLYLYGSYAGLLLCIAGCLRPRRRETALFAVFTVVCALWMLGDSTPIGAGLFAVLPGFIQIGLHPEFALVAFALSFAVLAGLATDQFIQNRKLAYALAAFVAIDLIAVSSGRLMNAFPTAREPGVDAGHFDGSAELIDGMRKLVNTAVPPWRIDTQNDSLSWAMCAPITKVPSANGNDPFSPARVIEARLAFCKGQRWGRYYEVSDLSSPILDLMNVRYVLSRSPIAPAALDKLGLAETGKLPARHVYENRSVLPRFFLVSRLRRASSLEQASASMRAADFDPGSEAVVEGPIDELPASSTTESGTVTVKQYTPRRITLDVDAPAAALLVASETNYPGWRAFVDGQPTHLYYTNVAFRGVAVPAGCHQIVMEFAPRILWPSIALSVLAWMAWGAAWWKGRP